jgi:lipopolysaccharide biosynthesis protein
LIAFYLPQFHPIPENDRFWGRGFTEWRTVARGKPLFPGHHQPHLPADLGFYDLRLAETRRAQAALAAEYGISGFCYYHYWFAGRRLLHAPLDQMLASGEPNFPFCLCWANENWTRAWDGQKKHVLIEQTFSEDDDRRHMEWLARVFRDPRYIRVDQKPLFLVYRAGNLPAPKRTTAIWRHEARCLGVGEICLGRVESFPSERGDPRLLGFDMGVEFQPDWVNLSWRSWPPLSWFLSTGAAWLKLAWRRDWVYDYEAVVEAMLRKATSPYPCFAGVTPRWDNSPRRRRAATILVNSTPARYERWLRTVIERTRNRPVDQQLIFINAWNEWSEGSHLEPDLEFGRGYLEATRNALAANGWAFHQSPPTRLAA